jgi:hypothetical protein
VRIGYAKITDSQMQPGRNSMRDRLGNDLRGALTMFEPGENVVILTGEDYIKLYHDAVRYQIANEKDVKL